MADKPFPRNPYVIGVPLTADVGFYGRQKIFTFVKDTLEAEHQNVIVLYGQRRVGKTSLLHQIARQVQSSVQPVYFDLQGKEGHSLGKVLYTLARTIGRPLKLKSLKQSDFDDAGRFFRETFLPLAYQQLDNRRLLLLFDEFDVLGDELSSPEAASETLFPYLQHLIMHERQIAFIFVVGRRIEELATHFQAIFKQAAYRRVGLLDPTSARDLIVEPTKDILTFSGDAIEAIFNLTAGHPYFTQLMCFETFNAMKNEDRRIVAEADIFDVVDQAIESGHGALTWFWDGLPRAERFIMSAVAHVSDDSGLASQEAIRQILEKHRIILTGVELTDAPDRLVEWEMLRREGPDNYRFVVELVRRWITKSHSLESARRDVDYISQRAVRLYENARDAHTANDLEYAREEYRRALNANPNHSGAQLGLAQVIFELGDLEESIEAFTKAYALDEMSARDGLVRARLAQGQKLEAAGQIGEAIVQYNQALKVAPTNEDIRRRLADAWAKKGYRLLDSLSVDETITPFQEALEYGNDGELEQDMKLALEIYIQQAKEKRDYDEALKGIRRLRELFPNDKSALTMEFAFWTRRGDAMVKHGKAEKAIQSYQQALKLKPKDPALVKKLKEVTAEWEAERAKKRITKPLLWAAGGAAIALIIIAVWLYVFQPSQDITETTAAVSAPAGTELEIYDDFNDPAFNNAFHPELWEEWPPPPNQIAQGDGMMNISQDNLPDANTELLARQYSNFPIENIMLFEAELMLSPEEYQGNVHLNLNIALPSGDAKVSQCAIGIGEGEQAETFCWDNISGEDYFTKKIPVGYGTWHIFLIEVNTNEQTINYTMDGRLLGSRAFDTTENFKESLFMFNIGVWGISDEVVTGHFNEVRIGAPP